ncbi:MAG: methylmalonyl Co-A mutase-associated GTPase MeaB [Synergistaceae bacterium]|jgi:LAO/AO transport system kinase|nr:methylmalonyl Co-A mutase-associated GTPase MeaB [Synergistaceae bacterium]
MEKLIARALEGDHRSIARLISLVESESPQAEIIMRKIYPHSGKAHIIGLTGSPGAGKSTLADKIIAHFKSLGKTVGVIAVDPSSPFTGGAILGDRLRMQQHAVDPDVFIRSMGTRGSLGGLSRSTQEAALILDACGKDVVLIETVGVGQSEVDIVKIADTVGLILVPGMGDDIQIMKAGIMEIADIFIVNKADRDGADRVATEVNMMLDLLGMRPWRPPVLKTVAERSEGVEEVVSEMVRHADFLRRSEEGRRRRWQRLGMEVEEILRREIAAMVEVAWEKEKSPELFELLAARKTTPYEVAERILGTILTESCD